MSNYNGAKKRVEVDKIVRCIKKGSSWEDVASEFGFESAEKIRDFVKDRCNKSRNQALFREIDKKAKKNR